MSLSRLRSSRCRATHSPHLNPNIEVHSIHSFQTFGGRAGAWPIVFFFTATLQVIFVFFDWYIVFVIAAPVRNSIASTHLEETTRIKRGKRRRDYHAHMPIRLEKCRCTRLHVYLALLPFSPFLSCPLSLSISSLLLSPDLYLFFSFSLFVNVLAS